MLCAVYTSKILYPLNDSEMIQVFKQYQELNLTLEITGCLVHHTNELLHFVEGDKKSINDFYLKKGMTNFIKHADPIYLEEKNKLIFEYPYVISEALWKHPEGSTIPILNHVYLSAMREQLGNRTLALNFFWKCLDEMMHPSKCGL